MYEFVLKKIPSTIHTDDDETTTSTKGKQTKYTKKNKTARNKTKKKR